MEQWRAIAGWVGWYEVSDLGRIRSLDRVVHHPINGPTQRRGRILNPSPNPEGYLIATLCAGGERYAKTVHSLVLEAFIGSRPRGMEILHGNDDPSDNRLQNLSYGTRQKNSRDAVSRRRNFNTRKDRCGICGGPFNYTSPRTGYRGCRACRNEASRRSRKKAIA